MYLAILKITSGLLFGASVLTLGGPVLGEAIATFAPPFTRRAAQAAKALGIPYEEVSFQTDGGLLLGGWYFPSGGSEGPAIVYAPATARDQRSGLDLVRPFHEAGFAVLLFSYRGHGASEGDPLGFSYGAHERDDVDAAVRYLTEARGSRWVGLVGHSAGAVSALLSASGNAGVGAVAAIAPFGALEQIWETNRPAFVPHALLRFGLRMSELRKDFDRSEVMPLDTISAIAPRPLLLVHGGDDARITEEQARALFAAAEQPKRLRIVDGADHAGVAAEMMGPLSAELVSFFRRAYLACPDASPGVAAH